MAPSMKKERVRKERKLQKPLGVKTVQKERRKKMKSSEVVKVLEIARKVSEEEKVKVKVKVKELPKSRKGERGMEVKSSEVAKVSEVARKTSDDGAIHLRDDVSSDDGYVRQRKEGIRVPDGGGSEDEGFYVDRGVEGIVELKSVDVGSIDDKKVHIVQNDDRPKRPKVANSLKSLRLALAAKKKEMQGRELAKLLKKKGFSSDEDE